jgi:Rnl2 family RNA ligase
MEFKHYSSIERSNKIYSEEYSKAAEYFFDANRGWRKNPKTGKIVSYSELENMSEDERNCLIFEKIADTKCIWQQKVHGANFAIYFDGNELKIGKRSSFIGIEDNFMGNRWVKFVDELKPKLDSAYSQLKELYPHIIQAAFHCELAGGHYNGEGEGQIQGNTHYCKEQFLYFFDIRIFFETSATDENGNTVIENTIINPLTSIKIFEDNGIYHAQVRGQGTLLELVRGEGDWTNYVSRELAGGQIVESEGMVIKSVEEGKLYFGESRVIMKKINPAFEESTDSKKNHKKADDKGNASKEAVDFVIDAERHVTKMRLDKVCGNIGISEANFEGKMFPEILKAVIEDIVKEMKSEGVEMPVEDFKYINSKLSSLVAPMIRSKFF